MSSYTLLCKAEVFKEGAQVWFLPDKKNCYFTQLVDWYLNFQTAKMAQYTPPQMPREMMEIAREEEIEIPDFSFNPHLPALISSKNFFPNLQTIIIPIEGTIDQWLNKVNEYWKKLNQPKARIFLPKEFTEIDFKKSWPKSTQLVEIVLDQNHN